MSAFIPSQKDPKLITPVHSLEMMSPGDQDAGSRSVWLCGRASHGHDREAPAGLLKAEGLECFRGMRWTANVVRFGVRRSFHLVHSRASDSCQWLCLSSVLTWILFGEAFFQTRLLLSRRKSVCQALLHISQMLHISQLPAELTV